MSKNIIVALLLFLISAIFIQGCANKSGAEALHEQREGGYEDEIEYYSKVIEDERNNTEQDCYCNRACAYMGTGEYAKAIEDCTRALQLNPYDADTYCNRGYSYYILGDYEKAIEDYEQTIELNENNICAYHSRGIAYHKMNKYDKAIEDYTKVIELDPDNVKAYNNRASALLAVV
ncbi:MAG: tetratricopeptide repeat protein [Campylobacteraceae bacterium]|jgi:superkiller protein 3|nr:tetratricopeptide repeat protein [Campylobacteraceae bacterium]